MLNQIISYEDKQKFLKLRDSHIISAHCPKFIESSISVAQTRRTEMKGGSRNMQISSIVPRINGDKPLSMLSAMIKGDFGKVREHISTLFELGLGVPKQHQIAMFLREAKADPDTISALKEVRKMVIAYQETYEENLNTEFFYPASYIAQVQTLNTFVSHDAKEDTLQVRAPKGIPVLLMYRLDNPSTGEFVLTDAYDMTAKHPTPFAHIMLRPQLEFPKSITSLAIKKHSQYMLVLGTLTSAKGEEFVRDLCLDVDVDDNADMEKDVRDSLKALEFIAHGLGIQAKDGSYRSANSNIAKTLKQFNAMGFTTNSKTVKHDQVIRYCSETKSWSI